MEPTPAKQKTTAQERNMTVTKRGVRRMRATFIIADLETLADEHLRDMRNYVNPAEQDETEYDLSLPAEDWDRAIDGIKHLIKGLKEKCQVPHEG